MARLAALVFGFLSYGLFGVSLIWLLAFLTNIGIPLSIDRGDLAPEINTTAWNIFLLVLFGVQHSVMARPAFKRWWTRTVPSVVERSLYVFVSSTLVLALCILWKPMPNPVWQAESAFAQAAWWSGFALGFIWLIGSSFLIDHFELLGLKQVWFALRRKSPTPLPFSVRGLYKVMRHPIYVGWLLIFWCAPVMSEGRFLFAAGMTLYTLIAVRFEERDLIASHGDAYTQYRRDVPALLPAKHLIRRLLQGKSLAVTALLLGGVLAGFALDLRLIQKVAEGVAVTLETASLERVTVRTSQGVREAVLAVPSDVQPRRLVVLLHGAGGDANRLRLLTARRFEALATVAGWAVVYPEGIGGSWNDCRTVPDYPAQRADINDVAYLDALIAQLRARYRIPAKQVLLGGFSNGGHMALRMAIERPDAIGGIAIVGAHLPMLQDSECREPQHPLHTMIVAGTADPVSPYEGGEARGLRGERLGGVESVDRTLQRFAVLADTLNREPRVEQPAERIERTVLRGRRLIWQVALIGGGHAIPGASIWFPPSVGVVSRDIDFADEVLNFIDGW